VFHVPRDGQFDVGGRVAAGQPAPRQVGGDEVTESAEAQDEGDRAAVLIRRRHMPPVRAPVDGDARQDAPAAEVDPLAERDRPSARADGSDVRRKLRAVAGAAAVKAGDVDCDPGIDQLVEGADVVAVVVARDEEIDRVEAKGSEDGADPGALPGHPGVEEQRAFGADDEGRVALPDVDVHDPDLLCAGVGGG